MAIRKGHGGGAGVPRVEVLPVDELPCGVQEPVQAPHTGERRKDGTWTKGARTAQRAGGKARRGATRLARQLGLASLADDALFAPYLRAAEDFRRAQVTKLAREVGGGVCGPAPASVIASAAMQAAASRFLFDRGVIDGDAEALAQSSRLANDSRQNLLAAHELCAKEAEAARRAAKGQRQRFAGLGLYEREPAPPTRVRVDDQENDGAPGKGRNDERRRAASTAPTAHERAPTSAEENEP